MYCEAFYLPHAEVVRTLRGTMPLLIKKDERYYPGRDGALYKSVTTVLKCISPFQNVRQSFLEEARDDGLEGHRLVAQLAQGIAIPKEEWYEYNQPIRNAVTAYERFRTKVHLHPEQVELEIINEVDEYGCTIDYIGTIPTGRVIIDWKTGAIHHIAIFQLAAYYKAYILAYPKHKVIGGYAVQLDKKDGRPHPFFVPAIELDRYFTGFLAMKTMSDQMDEAELFIKGGAQWK